MTAPEVQFVLDAVRDHYPGGVELEDIPLERIDRDNSDNLDGTWTHRTSADPEEMNFIGAALVSRPDEPMGTEFDLQGSAIVSVQLIGLHVSANGAIDPQKGTADAANRDYPTITWDDLTENVRDALTADAVRMYPSVGRSDTAYTDMIFVPGTWTDNSHQYADWYQLSFDLAFRGFESLG